MLTMRAKKVLQTVHARREDRHARLSDGAPLPEAFSFLLSFGDGGDGSKCPAHWRYLTQRTPTTTARPDAFLFQRMRSAFNGRLALSTGAPLAPHRRAGADPAAAAAAATAAGRTTPSTRRSRTSSSRAGSTPPSPRARARPAAPTVNPQPPAGPPCLLTPVAL